MPSQQPKIALVHDDFSQAGGAESLFATIAALYPEAPIYTSLVNWKKLPESIQRERIHTSFMQKIPFAQKFFKIFLPLYPFAFESFNLDGFDLVLSSTTRFAKAVITKPETVSVSYVNSTPRFLWDEDAKREYLNPLLKFLLVPFFSWLKRWDKVSSARVDYYIANSANVAHKVADVYGHKAEVIFPFAGTDFFKPAKIHNWKLRSREYFLVVSRLVKWKKIEIAIQAAAITKSNLVIIGEGPDKSRLEKISKNLKSSTIFVGKVTAHELRQYYQNTKALIVTQEEDFGIAAVEAQACGRPVIAYGKGGVAEVVIDGKTGLLFKKQTKESLKGAIEALGKVKWESAASRKNALRFSKAVFTKGIESFIEQHVRQTG